MDSPNDSEVAEGLTTENVTTATVTTTLPSGTQQEDYEARYKGLQKVMAKKDQQLVDLQARLDTLATQMEELRPQVDQSSRQARELEESKGSLEKELEKAKAEAQMAKQRLAQSTIIMKEFPQLNELTEYIPQSDDEDVFRESAKALDAKVKMIVDAQIKRLMAGATAPQPSGKQSIESSAEADRLWDELMRVAGVPGKEREYADLNSKWIKLKGT